jgi:hypothetical protein
MKIQFSWRRQNGQDSPSREADIGSNHVFYLRDDGIVTAWYFVRRCEEECYRAQRYGQTLALLVAEPAAEAECRTVQTRIRSWLAKGLRKVDIPAYLGDGRYAVLLPQSDDEKATNVADRLRETVKDAKVGLSSYPQDGASFDELLAAATQRYDAPAAPLATEELAA